MCDGKIGEKKEKALVAADAGRIRQRFGAVLSRSVGRRRWACFAGMRGDFGVRADLHLLAGARPTNRAGDRVRGEPGMLELPPRRR